MVSKRKKSNERRVVVTGLGVVSSIGIGWQEFWKNLIAGKSGISKIESFDTSEYDRHYGGEVKNFDPSKFIDRRKIPYLGRTSQFAIAASKMALEDAGLEISDIPSNRMGVCVGTTMGEPQIMESIDKRVFAAGNKYQVDPLSAFSYSAGTISGNLAFEFELKGKNMVFSTACASGNYSICYACDLIKSGKADCMLAGGGDALSRIAFTGFSRLYAMAPEKCQPFDKNRKGMMVGEGAGAVILEPLDVAVRRKANIYAEIMGYGLSCDAHHMTNPSPGGIQLAIQRSLEDSGIKPKQVDYINAHGTGTIENDKAECAVLKNVFGDALRIIPVSSIKSMIGHTLGGASAIEAITCCLVLNKSKIPPTINLEEQDPDCNIFCVPNKMKIQKVNISLNNSSAFGGNNGSLILKNLKDIVE